MHHRPDSSGCSKWGSRYRNWFGCGAVVSIVYSLSLSALFQYKGVNSSRVVRTLDLQVWDSPCFVLLSVMIRATASLLLSYYNRFFSRFSYNCLITASILASQPPHVGISLIPWRRLGWLRAALPMRAVRGKPWPQAAATGRRLPEAWDPRETQVLDYYIHVCMSNG